MHKDTIKDILQLISNHTEPNRIMSIYDSKKIDFQIDDYSIKDMIIFHTEGNIFLYKGNQKFYIDILKNIIFPLICKVKPKMLKDERYDEIVSEKINELLTMLTVKEEPTFNLEKPISSDYEACAKKWVEVLKCVFNSIDSDMRSDFNDEKIFWHDLSLKIDTIEKFKNSESYLQCLEYLMSKGKIILHTTLESYFEIRYYKKLCKIVNAYFENINLNIFENDFNLFKEAVVNNIEVFNKKLPVFIIKMQDKHFDDYTNYINEQIKHYIKNSSVDFLEILEFLNELTEKIKNDKLMHLRRHLNSLIQTHVFLNNAAQIEKSNIGKIKNLCDDYRNVLCSSNETFFIDKEIVLLQNHINDEKENIIKKLIQIFIKSKIDYYLFYRFEYFSQFDIFFNGTLSPRINMIEKINESLTLIFKNVTTQTNNEFFIKYLKEKIQDMGVIFPKHQEKYFQVQNLSDIISEKLEVFSNSKSSVLSNDILEIEALKISKSVLYVSPSIDSLDKKSEFYQLVFGFICSACQFNYLIKNVRNCNIFKKDLVEIMKTLKKIVCLKWKYIFNNKNSERFKYLCENLYKRVLQHNIILNKYTSQILSELLPQNNIFPKIEHTTKENDYINYLKKNDAECVCFHIMSQLETNISKNLSVCKSKHKVYMENNVFSFNPNLDQIFSELVFILAKIKEQFSGVKLINFEKLINIYINEFLKVKDRLNLEFEPYDLDNNLIKNIIDTNDFCSLKDAIINAFIYNENLIRRNEAFNQIMANEFLLYDFQIEFDEMFINKETIISYIKILKMFKFLLSHFKNLRSSNNIDNLFFYAQFVEFINSDKFKAEFDKFIVHGRLIEVDPNFHSEMDNIAKNVGNYTLMCCIKEINLVKIDICDESMNNYINKFMQDAEEKFLNFINQIDFKQNVTLKIKQYESLLEHLKCMHTTNIKLKHISMVYKYNDVNIKDIDSEDIKSYENKLINYKKLHEFLNKTIEKVSTNEIQELLSLRYKYYSDVELNFESLATLLNQTFLFDENTFPKTLDYINNVQYYQDLNDHKRIAKEINEHIDNINVYLSIYNFNNADVSNLKNFSNRFENILKNNRLNYLDDQLDRSQKQIINLQNIFVKMYKIKKYIKEYICSVDDGNIVICKINDFYRNDSNIHKTIVTYDKICNEYLINLDANIIDYVYREIKNSVCKLFEHLEQYKKACPRIYFLSNEEILSLSNNPSNVFEIITKTFAIDKLITKNDAIYGFYDQSNKILFQEPITITKDFVFILNKMEREMFDYVYKKLTKAILSKDVIDINTFNAENKNFVNIEKSVFDDICVQKNRCVKNVEKKIICNKNKKKLPNENFKLIPKLRLFHEKIFYKSISSILHKHEYHPKNDMLMTPLTQKIFTSFMLYVFNDAKGMILHGKSGSGKTETVKYFAKKTGHRIMVFCCDENTNIHILEQLLYKCYQTGSYLCLDEFNRLSSEAMSSLHEIILRNDKKYGSRILLFLTMNIGYLGRFKIPKSLHNIFGSIRVENPDLNEIANFYIQESKFLIGFFSRCSKMFRNLDFGIRALKTVLSIFLQQKQELSEILKKHNYNPMQINNENILLFSIAIYVIPMLNINMKKLFVTNIEKLYNFSLPSLDYNILCLKNRHGIIIYGEHNTGKSTFIKNNFKKNVVFFNYYTSNVFDSESFLTDVKENDFIVFDCQIESEWIENFNSALDENKFLIIKNQRIDVSKKVFIFETDNISNITMATITRVQLIYFEKKNTEACFCNLCNHKTVIYSPQLFNRLNKIDIDEPKCTKDITYNEQFVFYLTMLNHFISTEKIFFIMGSLHSGKRTIIYEFIKQKLGKLSFMYMEELKFEIEIYHPVKKTVIFTLDRNYEKFREFYHYDKIGETHLKNIVIIPLVDKETYPRVESLHKLIIEENKDYKLQLIEKIQNMKIEIENFDTVPIKMIRLFFHYYKNDPNDIILHFHTTKYNNVHCRVGKLNEDSKNVIDYNFNLYKQHIEQDGASVIYNTVALLKLCIQRKENILFFGKRLSGKMHKIEIVMKELNITDDYIIRSEKLGDVYKYEIDNAKVEDIENLQEIEPVKPIVFISEEYFQTDFYTIENDESFNYACFDALNIYKIISKSYSKFQKDKKNYINKGQEVINKYLDQTNQLQKTLDDEKKELILLNELTETKKSEILLEKEKIENMLIEIKNEKLALDEEIVNCKNTQKIITDELDSILPLIKASEEGLKLISKTNLIELRSMNKPPEIIKTIIECVYIIMNDLENDNITWEELRAFIKKDDFIQKITNYDFQNVVNNSETKNSFLNFKKNEKLSLFFHKSDFVFEKADNASKACGPLFMWIEAIYKYIGIENKIKPLRDELLFITKKIHCNQEEVKKKEVSVNKLQNELCIKEKTYEECAITINKTNLHLIKIEKNYNNILNVIKVLSTEINKWINCNSSEFCILKYTLNLIFGNINDYNFYSELIKLNLKNDDNNNDLMLYSDINGNIYNFNFDSEKISETQRLKYLTQLKRCVYVKDFETKCIDISNFIIIDALEETFKNKIQNNLYFQNNILIKNCNRYSPEIYRLLKNQMKSKKYNVILTGSSDNKHFQYECYNVIMDNDIKTFVIDHLFDESEIKKNENLIYKTEDKLLNSIKNNKMEEIIDLSTKLEKLRDQNDILKGTLSEKNTFEHLISAAISRFDFLYLKCKELYGVNLNKNIFKDFLLNQLKKNSKIAEKELLYKVDLFYFWSFKQKDRKSIFNLTIRSNISEEINKNSYDYLFITNNEDCLINIKFQKSYVAGVCNDDIYKEMNKNIEKPNKNEIDLIIKNIQYVSDLKNNGNQRCIFVLEKDCDYHRLMDECKVVYCETFVDYNFIYDDLVCTLENYFKHKKDIELSQSIELNKGNTSFISGKKNEKNNSNDIETELQNVFINNKHSIESMKDITDDIKINNGEYNFDEAFLAKKENLSLGTSKKDIYYDEEENLLQRRYNKKETTIKYINVDIYNNLNLEKASSNIKQRFGFDKSSLPNTDEKFLIDTTTTDLPENNEENELGKIRHTLIINENHMQINEDNKVAIEIIGQDLTNTINLNNNSDSNSYEHSELAMNKICQDLTNASNTKKISKFDEDSELAIDKIDEEVINYNLVNRDETKEDIEITFDKNNKLITNTKRDKSNSEYKKIDISKNNILESDININLISDLSQEKLNNHYIVHFYTYMLYINEFTPLLLHKEYEFYFKDLLCLLSVPEDELDYAVECIIYSKLDKCDLKLVKRIYKYIKKGVLIENGFYNILKSNKSFDTEYKGTILNCEFGDKYLFTNCCFKDGKIVFSENDCVYNVSIVKEKLLNNSYNKKVSKNKLKLETNQNKNLNDNNENNKYLNNHCKKEESRINNSINYENIHKPIEDIISNNTKEINDYKYNSKEGSSKIYESNNTYINNKPDLDLQKCSNDRKCKKLVNKCNNVINNTVKMDEFTRKGSYKDFILVIEGEYVYKLYTCCKIEWVIPVIIKLNN